MSELREASSGAVPERANSAWGRTALMLQALAWAFGITTWLILAGGFLNVREQPREWAAVYAVGGVASFIFAAWSVRWAVRACIRGERLRFPILVFVLLIILVSAVSGSLWWWIVRGELPEDDVGRSAIYWGVPILFGTNSARSRCYVLTP